MFDIVFRTGPRRTICFFLRETSILVHQLLWLAQNRLRSIDITSCVANRGDRLLNVYFF